MEWLNPKEIKQKKSYKHTILSRITNTISIFRRGALVVAKDETISNPSSILISSWHVGDDRPRSKMAAFSFSIWFQFKHLECYKTSKLYLSTKLRYVRHHCISICIISVDIRRMETETFSCTPFTV